jgi:hypothetical protein
MVLPSLQMALVLLTTRAAVQGPEEVSSPRWALDGRRISASLRAAHSSCVSKLDCKQEHDPGGRSRADRPQGAQAPTYIYLPLIKSANSPNLFNELFNVSAGLGSS